MAALPCARKKWAESNNLYIVNVDSIIVSNNIFSDPLIYRQLYIDLNDIPVGVIIRMHCVSASNKHILESVIFSST